MCDKKLGVLVIDMQKYFVKYLHDDERTSLIANQKRALQLCQKNKIPVIQVEWSGEGETLDELREIIMQCKQYIFIKSSNDAFKTKGFDNILELAQINHLLVMGINLSACVLETVMSARRYDYKVTICTDLVADAKDISSSTTESSLCIMKNNSVTISTDIPIL